VVLAGDLMPASTVLVTLVLDGTEDFLATVLPKLCPQMELEE